MASKEVENLRAEYNKVRRNVGSKISRVKKSTGAEISGTEYDPRKPPGAEKRMNRVQLQSAINKMREFNRPLNKFVSLQGGTPVPARMVAPFVRKVNELNSRRQKFAEKLDEKPFPGAAKTPKEFQAQYAKGKGADGGFSGLFDEVSDDVSGITSLKALKRLESHVDKQLKPDQFKDNLDKGKAQMGHMLDIVGQHENADMLRELSDYQFAMLWYGTVAPERVFMYDSDSDRAVTREDVDTSGESELREFLTDASRLPNIPITGREWGDEIKKTANKTRKRR
jgi:hypothetical protein